MYKSSIEKYIAQLDKSGNTVQSYQRDLMQMNDYLEANPDKTVADFAELIVSEKASSTASRVFSSLNSFFKYLIFTGSIDNNPMDGITAPKVIKNPRHVFTDDEKLVLREMPKGYSDKAVRDRAMISIMLDTGLKASSIINLKLDDVKNLALPAETQTVLDDYIYGSRESLIAGNACDRLFANCDGKPLSRQGFWKIIKKYTKDGGI